MNMLGYHCTTIDKAELIRLNGFKINTSEDVPGDLGNGIYFYINIGSYHNAAEMAKKFGQQYRSDSGKNSLALIKVEFDNSKIVDMRDIISKEYFDIFRKNNEAKVEKIFDDLKNDIDHYSGSIKRGNLDGFYFNILQAQSHKISGFIKDTYTPVDMRGYKRSNFPNAVECCVFDPTIIEILNISKVESEG